MSNTRKKKPTTDLRGALAAKRVRTTHYYLPLVDSETADAAAREFQMADTELTTVRRFNPDDADVVGKSEQERAEARTKLDACFHKITFQGLPPAEYEALVSAHTSEADDDKRDSADDPFTYALVVACVQGSDLTAEEWEAELKSDRWTEPDRVEFMRAVLDANTKAFTHGIPLG